jgi:ParB/RepB/Spo0J family partition protein
LQTSTELRHLPVDLIDEPHTPSRIDIDEAGIHELAASIATQGLLEPIGVKPAGDSGRFRLVYGHRRLLAVRTLGRFDIAALILPETVSEEAARQHENNQRVQLTPVEEARELRRWHDAGESHLAIAARVSRSLTWVQQRLRLLRYPDDVLTAVHKHGLPLAVADLLSQITHQGYRELMTSDALAHGASSTTVACWLQHYLANQARIEANNDMVAEIAANRHTYKVMAPCEYCGDPTDMQLTHLWRLCRHCTDGLRKALAAQEEETTHHART